MIIRKQQLKPLNYCMALAFSGSLAMPAMAQQQPTPPAQTNQEPQKLKAIEVTGSSIKRISGESALPVTVIRRTDIDRTGATSTADLVNTIVANNGGGYQSSAALGDAARPGFAGASLRSLGSNNTLVLLNGRRLSIYAFDGGAVSLNDIPLEAVDRIEILRDGASHLYGTDAVAGVINLITRKDFKGGLVNLVYARPTSKGGVGSSISGTIGFGDISADNFNVLINLSSSKQEALKANQRDFAKTAFIPGDGVNRLSSNAFPAAVSVNGGLFSPAAPRYNRPAGSPATPGALSAFGNAIPGGSQYGCLPPVSYGVTDNDGRCRFDYASVIDIIPEVKRNSAYIQGTWNISEAFKLSAEYAKARNDFVFRISPTPISEATTFNGDPVLLPASSQYYPSAWLAANFPTAVGQDLNLYYRSVEAGPRTNGVKADQDRIVLQGEGTVGKLDYRVGFLKAQSKAVESYLGGYILESKIIPAFATGQINPFGPNTGAGLQALLDTQLIAETRNAKSSVQIIDGRASYEIAQLPAGSLSAALGFERRNEKFSDNPLAVLNAGDIIGGGGSQLPVSGKRTVSAVYGEVNIPIVKSVEALVAGRYDKYSDFGNTTNPKLGLRWQPNKEFLMRGSVGTGFRAPTLDNLFAAQTQTNTGEVFDDPLYDSVNGGCAANFDGRYCGAQLTARQGGNTALTPEKSRSATLGFIIEPTKDFSIGIDIFRINQKGLIGFVSPDTKLNSYIEGFNPATGTSSSRYAADVVTRFDPSVNRNVIDYVSSVFQNLGEQRTTGADLSMKFRLPKSEMGDMRVNWEGSYIHSLRSKGPDDTEFGDNEVGIFARNGAVLRFKQRIEFIWGKGPWEGTIGYNWQSRYRDANLTPAGVARTVGTYETASIGLEYSGIKNLKIRARVDNLLDSPPPFTNQGSYFQVGYDPANTSPLGRVISISGEYRFW